MVSDTSDRSRPFAPSDKAALFELIIESARDFAIYTTDLAGLVTSWNVGAERLFGYTADEILGSSSDVVFPSEDRGDGARERLKAAADGRAEDERWHQRKDGRRFWASGLLMPLRTGDGFLKIAQDRSEAHIAAEQLRLSEERFRVLATNIPQLVFLTRPNGDRTWPSQQWIAFTGLSAEDSMDQGWLTAIHPDDIPATCDAWIEAARRREYYVEHRVWSAREKEYRWHQTRARPLDTEEASDEWVGTMTDIHELKGLQDRQQVLMAELQHRTRNLLAVVQAIAKQTLRKSPSPDDFGEELEGRLSALSRVQSLLARGDLPDIDLRNIVESELLAHDEEAVAGGRVVIEGPTISLPGASAQALALGLHELATNAVKHGALARPEGRLSVRWRLLESASEPRVSLEWRETGVPIGAGGPPRRKGYGSELIERALPYQLKARTRLEFTPEGVLCVIDAPVRGERNGHG